MPQQEWSFSMALADAKTGTAALRKTMHSADSEFSRIRAKKQENLKKFSIRTPDECWNRYVNEYLGLQLELVLQRGWPCFMMGTRDAAQDFTGAAAWHPEKVRKMILRILETERTDGWFVRQFSTEGRHGKHDARPYVDSGLWVWELVYEYICLNHDFSLLKEKLPFLDSDPKTTVLDHLIKLLNYYMNPQNIGEHGLCKILEGDWNDSVNAAGLKGRGESVMVSCHLIYCLKEAEKFFAHLNEKMKTQFRDPIPSLSGLEKFRDKLKKNIRTHALNKKGFLNGVFSDSGKWFFSNRDPDGKQRFNAPVNSFGMIAEIFTPAELKVLLNHIRKMRKDSGYPLFAPAVVKPMAGLGRIGSTDLRKGLGENGTCYNHGCHGFLSRALAAAGEGDFLYEMMQYLFPYDQSKHPVQKAKSAPYAVVNVYLDAPGREGMGGDTFFSGSIATAFRNVYEGMLGARPEPEGLRITPCFPKKWQEISGTIVYLQKQLEIKAQRKDRRIIVSVNGKILPDGFYRSR